MKVDLIVLALTAVLSALQILQAESRVFCYRRLRKRGNKCGGFLRRGFYSSPEACCRGRGRGFATRKIRLGRNRFRCSPCRSLLGDVSPPKTKTKPRRRGDKLKKKSRRVTTTTTTTTTTIPTTTTTTMPTASTTRQPFTTLPWPTSATRKDDVIEDYPPPKDDDGNVIVWEEWSPCSVSCGAGWRSRVRVCDGCDHNDYENVQSEPCMDYVYCSVDGNWGPWFPWAACSTTCGGGKRKRERQCNYPPPGYGGAYCQDDAVATLDCNHDPCPVNGQWGSWSEYSTCSQTCGQGLTTRSRECERPYPTHGGKYCQGKKEMTRKCEVVKCPMDGGWSLWSTWTLCSASCGQGLKERSRTCDSPRPNYGGKSCQGKDSDMAECYGGRPCPVNGGWTSWTNYGYCRGPRCGRGYQIRSRSCSKPRPSHGGKPCLGQRYERVACLNNKECPRNGSWCPWSEWNACSSTCKEDAPVQGRQRVCACPMPINGGRQCQGSSFQVQDCTNLTLCSSTKLVKSVGGASPQDQEMATRQPGSPEEGNSTTTKPDFVDAETTTTTTSTTSFHNHAEDTTAVEEDGHE